MKTTFFLFQLLFIFSCNQKTIDKDGIKYYEAFYGYNHPIKLSDEIGFSEIKNKKTYLKATYKNTNLVEVEKYLNNELFFRYVYIYDKDKLIKVIINGKEITI